MTMLGMAQSKMLRYRTPDGRSFYGEMVAPPITSSRPDSFEGPRRLLRTGPKTNVSAGVLMKSELGVVFLIANNEDVEALNLKLRMFRLFETNQQVTWQRKGTTLDTVTGLQKDAAPSDLGTIWCALESLGTASDGEIRVRQPKYRMITNAALQLGDIINGDLKVEVLTPQLGVTFAEVQ